MRDIIEGIRKRGFGTWDLLNEWGWYKWGDGNKYRYGHGDRNGNGYGEGYENGYGARYGYIFGKNKVRSG
jgi:hypothetical protein